VIVAFSVSPMGGDDSVGQAVAEAVRVVRASGLPNETNAMFTNIEGEWDEVMAVVKQAVNAVAAVSPRVSLVLKADIRPGYTDQLTAKVARIDDAWATRSVSGRDYDRTSRAMAADASASLASASSPPSATAWVTQWPRCSSSRPSATDWSALLTALIWVRTSMQYLSSSIIFAMPRTWPSIRRSRLA
jgi:uncharacterized protein (TIGR00106 family)